MHRRNLQILFIAVAVGLVCNVQSRRTRMPRELGYAMDLIDQIYVDPVDRDRLFQAAMTGMVESLDPFSGFIPADEYRQFQDIIQQHFGGLGIIIEGPPQVERITVVTSLFGTPAFKAGVEPGDMILAVDGTSTEGLTINDAGKLLRGPEGTSVQIELLRPESNQPIRMVLTRAAIELESVVGDRRDEQSRWIYTLEDHPNIGYLRINSFGERTAAETKAALDSIRDQTKAIVLDLRDNSGGLLSTASAVCDMFIGDGVLVTTRGRGEIVYDQIRASSNILVGSEVPVAVIINDQSASASEIVAACLQDHGRAVVVGERSFGKGSVQNIFELLDGRAGLKITTARYYPPSGRNIHRSASSKTSDIWGVDPSPGLEIALNDDERRGVFQRWRLKSNRKAKDSGESNGLSTLPPDPQLQHAVDYLLKQIENN